MNSFEILQIGIYIIALLALAPPVGSYMARVFCGEKTVMSWTLGLLETTIYKVVGVDPASEMNSRSYMAALLWFNAIGIIVVLALQLVQAALPLNPQGFGNVPWHTAVNTAVSFVTNTNWQSYTPEASVSYLTQMVGLAVQNFLSAATGFAVFLALTRGLTRKMSPLIGNFWVDVTRATVYVLLPLCVILTIVLMGQGVVQSFLPYKEIVSLEGAKQVIPLGPAASQIAIKQIGTNGGGFFNANSAHPLENPTPLTNFLEMFFILLLPAALTFTFGKMVKGLRQGWIIFVVMFLAWFAGLAVACYSEYQTNSVFHQSAIMEGKETRLGVANTVLWTTVTTVASNGSVNGMISSLSPLAGGVALFNIMLGEVIFGGVGAGMYGMLLFVLLTVFLAGLMVGRSPEYLGKKVEAAEIKMAILGILGPCAVILLGTAVSCVLPLALSSLGNKGPHGFSEMLYAFTSAAGNNGSAFMGLNANTVYYNLMLAVAMLIGRFVVILPCLAIAGSMAIKKITPPSAGTFSTDRPIFGILLIGTIIIVGALTFLPALSLGPIVEHIMMLKGQAF